jgi:uncharacterized membrane protein YfcA
MIDALNMEVLDIGLAGIIMCLAVAAQSAVGFGSALFAAPLLVWIGMPLPNVIALIATCSMAQASIGVCKLRADVPWRAAFVAIVVMTVSLLLGLFVLKKLVALNTEYIRLVMGCVLCLLVGIQYMWRPHPVARLHWGWGGGAFLASGFLGGVCGMNGPPLVLWSLAHDWSTQKTRGFLFAVFAVSNPILLATLSLTFGSSVLWSAAMGIAFLPLVYVGTRIGLPIGNRMKKDTLKNVAFALLLIIGVSAALPALLALLSGNNG